MRSQIFQCLLLMAIAFTSILAQSIVALNPTAWDTIFNGDNSLDGVQFTTSNTIILKPKAHSAPWDLKDAQGNLLGTSSCLLAAKNIRARNFEYTVIARTINQTRANYPARAWEAFWLVFSFKRLTSFTPERHEFNYFIHKPATSFPDSGGVEFGRATELIGQQFLGTNNVPGLTLNKFYTYTVRKQGFNVSLSIDGTPITIYNIINNVYTKVGSPFIGKNSTSDIFDSAEHTFFGLYTEDATVEISSVVITNLDQSNPITPSASVKVNSATMITTSMSLIVQLFLCTCVLLYF